MIRAGVMLVFRPRPFLSRIRRAHREDCANRSRGHSGSREWISRPRHHRRTVSAGGCANKRRPPGHSRHGTWGEPWCLRVHQEPRRWSDRAEPRSTRSCRARCCSGCSPRPLSTSWRRVEGRARRLHRRDHDRDVRLDSPPPAPKPLTIPLSTCPLMSPLTPEGGGGASDCAATPRGWRSTGVLRRQKRLVWSTLPDSPPSDAYLTYWATGSSVRAKRCASSVTATCTRRTSSCGTTRSSSSTPAARDSNALFDLRALLRQRSSWLTVLDPLCSHSPGRGSTRPVPMARLRRPDPFLDAQAGTHSFKLLLFFSSPTSF